MSKVPQPKNQTYGSARDLPSFKEMAEMLQGGKILTRLVAREQRPKLLEIERDMERLADLVDRFYVLLGPRNWIFTENLKVDDVETILNSCDDPADAEQQLIELYRRPDGLRYAVMRLQGHEGLRARQHQIQRARDHYDADQFDSCVLQLIAVMDGFVNDFQPGTRKGLAARDPDDMAAWDSVVGHHLGLTHALKTFAKTFKRRVDDEVFEVHRHGIMHGSIVNFDNVVVATKAWNMLFAVADWARSIEKSAKPVELKPPLSESLTKLRETKKARAELDDWQPSTVESSDDAFADHEIHRRTTEFLDAWRSANYGRMADYPSRMLVDNRSAGAMAGEMRDLFERHVLTDFTIDRLEHWAAAVWLAHGTATVNGEAGSLECRWLRQDDAGEFVIGTSSGSWWLIPYGPTMIWKAGSGLN